MREVNNSCPQPYDIPPVTDDRDFVPAPLFFRGGRFYVLPEQNETPKPVSGLSVWRPHDGAAPPLYQGGPLTLDERDQAPPSSRPGARQLADLYCSTRKLRDSGYVRLSGDGTPATYDALAAGTAAWPTRVGRAMGQAIRQQVETTPPPQHHSKIPKITLRPAIPPEAAPQEAALQPLSFGQVPIVSSEGKVLTYTVVQERAPVAERPPQPDVRAIWEQL